MTTAATTASLASTPTLAIDRIVVLGDNARDVDAAHVQGLAGSIALRGVVQPVIVRPYTEACAAVVGSPERLAHATEAGLATPLTVAPGTPGYVALVAGEHRLLAAASVGKSEIPVTVNDAGRQSAEAGLENELRKQSDPVEQARAVRTMIDEGYTYQATARILGWLRRRGDELVPDTKLVTSRLRILELPEPAQRLVADGRLQVSAVPRVLAFHQLAPDLLIDLLAAVEAGRLTPQDLYAPDWSGLRRLREILGARDRRAPFATVLDGVDEQLVRALKLGKRATAMWEAADDLNARIRGDRWYRPRLTVPFSDMEVDQARAVGALLELGDNDRLLVILDRGLYRDLARQAIARRLAELEGEQAAAAAERAHARRAAAERPRSAADLVEAEHRAHERDITRQAHATNLDLWTSLRKGLETVDPADMNVARFFAYGLLGADYTGEHWSPNDWSAQILAANGIRLVVAEHRSEVTPILKTGRPGRTRVTYGDVDEAIAYLWKYVDGARNAGELYGRVMVVYAAQHYARQRVLPLSKRRSSHLPASKDSIARRAFERFVSRHLPVSHRELERAIERAANDKQAKLDALSRARRSKARRTAAAAQSAEAGEQEPTADETLAELEDEEAERAAA